MKKILILVLLFCIKVGFAQSITKAFVVTGHSLHVVGYNFDGVVFKAEYKAQYPVFDTNTYKKNTWYTPSIGDIELTERVLLQYLKQRSVLKLKSVEGIVLENLRKSKRQYAGYVEPSGDRFVYVNGFPDNDEFTGVEKSNNIKQSIPRWYDDMIMVLDGGPSFWEAVINLKNQKVIFFGTHGSA